MNPWNLLRKMLGLPSRKSSRGKTASRRRRAFRGYLTVEELEPRITPSGGSPQAVVYVSTNWANTTDGGIEYKPSGSELAVYGTSAFADIQTGIDHLQSSGGTLYIEGDTYSAAFTVSSSVNAIDIIHNTNTGSSLTTADLTGAITLGKNISIGLDNTYGTASLTFGSGGSISGSTKTLAVTEGTSGTGTLEFDYNVSVESLTAGSSSLPLSTVNLNSAITDASGNNAAVYADTIAFGSSGSITAASADVTLYGGSAGTITAPASGTQVTTGTLSITSGDGIGSSSDPLEFNVTNLDTSSSGSNANQYLYETSSATIDSTGLNAGTGTIYLDDGTFTLGGSSRINSNSAVDVDGGTLALASYSNTISTLTLTSGSITGSTGVLTSTNTVQAESGTISGILGGSAGLTETTSGTVTLSGANTYTGTTTVDAGTLTLGSNNTIGSSSAVNVNGGTLAIGSYNDTVSTLTLTSGSVTGSTGVLTSTNTVQAESGTISAVLGGSAGLTKSTGSSVTLSGANTYTGTTTVNAGTLTLGASAAIGSSSSVNVAGGTLAIGSYSDTVNTLTLTSGSVTGSSGVLTSTDTVQAESGTISAILSGSAGLTKSTSAMVTLSGANTYTGSTGVSAGTLEIDGSTSGSSAVSVSSGATLDGTGTIGGNVSGAGTVAPGDAAIGILTIDGSFTPSGTVSFIADSPYTTAGTNYSQIVAAGSVDLSGATVAISGGSAAASGHQQLVLISKTSSGTMTAGTSPANGAVVTLGSGDFQLFYNAGSGSNNLILEANHLPVAVNDQYGFPIDSTLTVSSAQGVLANDTDSDGDTLTAVLVASPSDGSVTLNSNGSFTYTPDTNYVGPDSFTYKAFDGLGYSNTATVSLVMPLTFTAPSTQSGTEGVAITTLALSSDVSDIISGSTLTYLVSGLPAGLSFSPSTGAVTGTPALGTAAAGPYTVDATVTDGTYSAGVQFTWNVACPITFNSAIANQTNAEGATISTLSAAATDTISGSTVTYAEMGLPPGLKINVSNGNITGTVAYGATADGPYSVTVIAADNTYSASASFTWTITNPVTMTPVADQTNYEGASPSLTVSAADSISGHTLVYGAVGLPEGLKISTSTGVISGTIAAGAAQNGAYSITVAVGDGTYSANETFTWNVIDPVALTVPAGQTNNEGDTVSLTTGASDYYSGTVTYGATNLPSGLSISSSTGTITGTIAGGAAANGPYTVTLFADDGTYADSETFNWTVNSSITITDQGDQTNNVGDSPSVTISASDIHSGTLSFSGAGLPNGLSINSSSGVISGTITAGGTFEPVITVGDGTYTTTDTFEWDVAGAITITDDGAQAFNSGDAVSVAISATDTESGTLSYSASGLPSGLSINSSTGLITGTISASAGNDTTTITVGDGTQNEVDYFNWTVYPSIAWIVSNPGTQTSTEGTAISTLAISVTYIGPDTVVYSAAGLPPGLVMNPSDGDITGTPAAGGHAFDSYTVTVTANDGAAFDSQSFVWNIISPVSLTNPGAQSATEGTAITTLTLSASYGPGGTIIYSAIGLPPGLVLNPSSGAITGTPAVGDAAASPLSQGGAGGGSYDVTIQAAVAGYTAEQDLTWTVVSPISVTAVADQTNSENVAITTLSVSATDSVSGAMLSYSATGLPPGLKLNPTSGAITGTPSVGSAASGPYSVTVLAQDGTYSTSQTFNWTITSPVTITQPADQTNNEGDSVSLAISASDSVSGSTLVYGAVGLPTGLAISPTTGAITGTIAAGASANGPYSVTVSACDGTYSSAITFNWNVNSPVVIAIPADQTNNAGDSVSLTITATDAHSGGTMSWSGTGLPTGLSINSSTGAVTGTVTRGGYWSPVITASDGTYADVETFNWAVSSSITITDQGDQLNAIGDVLSTSASPPTDVLISATDTASGTLSYSASGLPPGLSINSSTGAITGTVSSGDSTTTPYAVTVTVNDGTNYAVDFFNWNINPSGPIVFSSLGDQTNTKGDEVALQIGASDSTNGALLYSATGLPTGLYINGYTGFIFGTISTSAASSNSVTITASDSINQQTLSFNWTVNAAGPVSMSNPGDQTNNEGDSVSLSMTAADTTSGATLYFVAFGLPPGLKINTSTGAITGTVALGAAYEGPYTVTVEAGDGTNSASQTFAWNVNSPITLTQPDDQTNNENDTVSFSITAADSISGSTMQFAALGLPPGLVINPSTGAITGTVAKGAAAFGPYSVTIIAGDGTYSGQATFNWNVNCPVAVTAPATQTNNDSDSVTIDIAATDSMSGSTLTFSALDLPAGLSINPTTGVISGTIAVENSNIGTFDPTIIANDGTYYNTTTFEMDVNSLISIADPGEQTNTAGDTVSVEVQATDSSSGTLVYTVAGLPSGLDFNTSTGLISGTISSGASAIGTYATTVTASDGTYTSSDTFSWTISASGTVTMSTPSNQSGTEGTASSTVSLSASDSTSGATLTYFAQGLPAGLKINPSTGAITGTPATNDSDYSPFTVTVTATDGTNFAQETLTWAIASPVTLAAISDATSTEGTTISTGGHESIDEYIRFTAIGLPTGLVINVGNGDITGTVATGAAANSVYSVTVVANDGTDSASQTFNWTINSPITLNAPADQSNNEGDSVSVSSSSSDSSGGTVTYTANGLPDGLKVNSATGAITGTVAIGTSTTGSFNFTLVASDGTYTTTLANTWTVNDPITTHAVAAESQDATKPVSLQLQASYTGFGMLTYFAEGLPAGLSINPSTGLISGSLDTGAEDTGTFESGIVVTDGTYTTTETVEVTIVGDRTVEFEAFAPVGPVAGGKGFSGVGPTGGSKGSGGAIGGAAGGGKGSGGATGGGAGTGKSGFEVLASPGIGHILYEANTLQGYTFLKAKQTVKGGEVPSALVLLLNPDKEQFALDVKKIDGASVVIDNPNAPNQLVNLSTLYIGYGVQMQLKLDAKGIAASAPDNTYYWVQYVNYTNTESVGGKPRKPETTNWQLEEGSDPKNHAYPYQNDLGDHLLTDTPTKPLTDVVKSVTPTDGGKRVNVALEKSPAAFVANYQKNVLGRLDSSWLYLFQYQTYLMKKGDPDPIGYVSWQFEVSMSATEISVRPVERKWNLGIDKTVWGK